MDKELRKKVAELMEAQVERLAYRFLTGSEKPADFEKAADTLTMEKVLEVDEKLRRVMEEPFRKLLREEGFDEDLDWILIPDQPEYAFITIPSSLQPRVKKRPRITTVILLRSPAWPLHFDS